MIVSVSVTFHSLLIPSHIISSWSLPNVQDSRTHAGIQSGLYPLPIIEKTEKTKKI